MNTPYITTDLTAARQEHYFAGGYLLQIGDRPACYAVCSEQEAIECWGRTPEHLESLAPDYEE